MRALVHDFLRHSTERYPDKTFIVAGAGRHSFADIDRKSDQVSAWLQELGVQRRDRVALFLDNSAELTIAIFGVLKAGAAFVPINPTTKAAKLAHVLSDCGARALIAESQLARVVQPARTQAGSAT